jgi:hypothetical protein
MATVMDDDPAADGAGKSAATADVVMGGCHGYTVLTEAELPEYLRGVATAAALVAVIAVFVLAALLLMLA